MLMDEMLKLADRQECLFFTNPANVSSLQSHVLHHIDAKFIRADTLINQLAKTIFIIV